MRTAADPRPLGVVIQTPIGPLRVECDAAGSAVTAIRFDGRPHDEDPVPGRLPPVLQQACRQLEEYFAGSRHEFTIALAPAGTDFQRAVWRQVAAIPWGQTLGYGEVAVRAGLSRAASRAVGAANGANPIPVVVPCHRVIGADGSLTGYAGGLARKAVLLRLEGALPREDPGTAQLMMDVDHLPTGRD